MKKFTFNIFLHVVIVTMLSCCKDNDPSVQPQPEEQMPPYSETGANTFAFKVDGKIVIAKNKANTTDSPILASFLPSLGYIFNCEGRYLKENYYESVRINIGGMNDTGKYKLNNSSPGQGAYFIGEEELSPFSYVTNKVDTGEVIITKLDTVNKIIAGWFRFVGEYYFGTEKKSITEGQFDVKYYP